MNTGERFTITFVTLDKKRKTGGDLVTLENARKHQAGNIAEAHGKTSEPPAPGETAGTNPNHTRNGTINIKCADGNIRKVHTRLIVKFNNEEVLL